MTKWTFVGKVLSLLFNTLSRLVIGFLPRRKCLLILWLQSPPVVILEPQKIVSHCFHYFPIYLPWNDGTMLRLKLQSFGHWCEELTHLKRPWCRERLRAGGEGDDRGWDGWMASPTQWTWIWANSGSWWWTGRSGMLQSMGAQRVRHDWATELNWKEYLTKWLLH